MITIETKFVKWLRVYAKISGWFTIILGLIVIAGWTFNCTTLKSILPSFVSMKANTAIAFVLSGISFLIMQKNTLQKLIRTIAQISASVVVLIGMITLLEYILNQNFGIDQLIFKEEVEAILTSSPGRMSANTAFNFIIIGLCLLFYNVRIRKNILPSQLLSIIVLLVTFLGLMGYIYSQLSLLRFLQSTPMAVHTTLLFIILSLGIIVSHPMDGFMKRVTNESSAGSMLRDLIPSVVILPFIIELLATLGAKLGLYDISFEPLAHTLGILLVFSALIWTTISKYEQAVNAKIKSQEFLSRMIESSNDCIKTVDLNGNLSYMSKGGQSLLEIEDISLYINKSWVNFWKGQDYNDAVHAIEKAKKGEVGIFSGYCETAKGTPKWWEVNVTPIKNEFGKIENLLAISRDITERKKSEEKLGENEEKFRSIFENSPLGKSMTSVDGSLKVNKSFCEILGYSEDELKIKKWQEITYPDDIQKSDKIVQSLIEGKQANARYEKRYIHKKGNIVWTDISTTLQRDSEGNPLFFITTINDITEKKDFENRILREKQYADLLIDSLPGLFYQINSEGKFTKWNKNFETVSGYSSEEMQKISPLDFFEKEEKNYIAESIQKVFTDGIATAEANFVSKDGAKTPFYFSGKLINIGEQIFLAGMGLNISEMRLAKEALQQSQQHLAQAQAMASIGSWEWDSANDKITGSEEFFRLFGVNPDKLSCYSQFNNLMHAEDRERVENDVAVAIKNNKIYDTVYRVLEPDGDYKYIHARGEVILDDNNIPIQLVGTCQDITELKIAEEQLKLFNQELEKKVVERTLELEKSNLLLDETTRLATLGGWEINLKNNKLSWSDVVYQIHEVDKSYIPELGTAINFYSPEAVPIITDAVQKVITDGTPFDVELELITAKNNRLWIRSVGQAFRENGEIVKIRGVFQDINQRKLAEIEVRKKSEELQLLSNELEIIIDSIPGLVFYKDTNNRFIRVNKYISDAYKMSKKQLEGIHLNDLHTKEQAQAYYEADLQVIRSRQPKINIEEPWETETGMRWISTSKIPHLNEKGEVVGVIGVSMDVTERKLDEEELKKHREHLEILIAEKTVELTAAVENLERSNKELEQFAYVASHDLQEPLRMVSSYTQLLGRRYKDKLDTEANDFINFAVDGANRMQRLINDLLDYSRVTTRGKPLEKLDLSSVIGQVIATLQNKIQDAAAMVSNDDLPSVEGDEIQISRVFQNLIDNALKFRRDGPPRIHISSKIDEDRVIISISDNGIGINEKYKDRIFTIFQRLHNRDDYPGTGIGLSICKRIVERHGGKIWFESEEGKGTTFYFTLNK